MILAQRYDRDSWLDIGFVTDNWDRIWDSGREHLILTVLAVGIGLLIAVPLGLLAANKRWTYGPIAGVTGVLYTLPSLALFALLVPITGVGNRVTSLIPLVAYTLLILIRNIVEGLDAVSGDVREAADGMGYTARARQWRIELPLALPSIMAGIRIATVSTIGLVTVTALIGQDSFGQFMVRGFQRDFRSEIMVGVIGSVALAVTADVVLVGLQRLAMPWSPKARQAP